MDELAYKASREAGFNVVEDEGSRTAFYLSGCLASLPSHSLLVI